MQIVVLSPHRDDAAFSLSLAIEAWISRGFNVEVVNCFVRSKYAPFSEVGSIHPNDQLSYVSALRSHEDKKWCGRFGAKLKLTDLNLKDAPLRLHCSTNDVCKLQLDPAGKAFAKIRAWFDRTNKDALVLPLALGGHIDHVTARDAAISAIRPLIATAFYEDLPYAARPAAAETIEDVANSLNLHLTPAFTEASRNVNDACMRKRRATLCYDSQVDDQVTHDISRFCSRYEGRERLWVNEGWRHSKLMAEGAGTRVGTS